MLRMWMYDLAREQAPTLDHLRTFCRLTEEAGFDAIGLYLEHRFAYPSAPWAQGVGCVTPGMIKTLESEFPNLQIVPFVNLLGHFEGMLYTEEGKQYREELFQGLQACASNPQFVSLCESLIDDILSCFSSKLIHIGGDETAQLGACPICKERVDSSPSDGKAEIYGKHFGPLARRVADAGRRPAVWGDMFKDHPTALDHLPKQTLIFDWKYFSGIAESASMFTERGFEVVGCPALHTYNATWFHIPQSEENVRQVTQDVVEMGLHGVCVTTWECGLFGAYDSLIPALRACGAVLPERQEVPAIAPRLEPINLRLSSDSFKVSFDPRGDLIPARDPYEEMSLAVGIVDNIIGLAVSEGADEIFFETGESATVIRHGHSNRISESGSLPSEQATNVAQRLKLCSGMHLYPRDKDQTGEMSGTVNGVPFRFEVRVTHRSFGPHFEMKRKEISNVIDHQPSPQSTIPNPQSTFLAVYLAESERYEEWARLMGVELQECGGTFAFGGIRSSLKCRFLLYSNPFLAWMHHGQEFTGEVGDRALAIFERAFAVAPNEATKDITLFARSAVEFVRLAEAARVDYANKQTESAIGKLGLTRHIFDDLERAAKRTNLRIGGSLADIERCRNAKAHVERVIQKIRQYGDGSLGYLPAFEIITHPKFVPHDQASWWLINKWANQ